MKEVRPGQPIVIGEMTITPLERVESYHGTGGLHPESWSSWSVSFVG